MSDLNWHPKEPDIIASCSIDTFIHIWDIRDQRKPCLSLSAVGKYRDYKTHCEIICKHLKRHIIECVIAGSSQVRWNTLSPNMLATAHDGDIKIWDQRKGNSPMQYIAAHLTKVQPDFIIALFTIIISNNVTLVKFNDILIKVILDTWFRLVSISTKSIGNI